MRGRRVLLAGHANGRRTLLGERKCLERNGCNMRKRERMRDRGPIVVKNEVEGNGNVRKKESVHDVEGM